MPVLILEILVIGIVFFLFALQIGKRIFYYQGIATAVRQYNIFLKWDVEAVASPINPEKYQAVEAVVDAHPEAVID